MYNDIENDFWKDKLVLIQQKNREAKPQKLDLESAKLEINNFKKQFPDYRVETEISENYIIWEVFVTDSVKLRLYIQSQIKASFMQNDGSEFIKIADAKFFSNPFPQIYDFVNELPSLLNSLVTQKNVDVRVKKQQKITLEMIKALVMKKLGKEADFTVKVQDLNFILEYKKNGEKYIKNLTMQNFVSELKEI